MKRRYHTVHFDRVKLTPPAPVSRREFLSRSAEAFAAGAVAVGAVGCGASLPGPAPSSAASAGNCPAAPTTSSGTATAQGTLQQQALAALGRTTMREPGSLPNPNLAAGTDTMPEIQHIVVLMMENHSFDNLFGMLGRGDGFTLDCNGLPTATNPYGDGRIQKAFEMPTTCQLSGLPSQEWAASHQQYNNGALDGFVQSMSGPVSMGYWTGKSLPFTYALASVFPIGDRFFCSMLGQTDPNRRFLIAGTAAGMTDDSGVSDLAYVTPGNGTIFDTLGAYNISWLDYAANFPLGATAELYPYDDATNLLTKQTLDQFFTDAAAGNLPSVCIVDPDYGSQSQENPQDIVVGEKLLAQVVNAVGSSPKWANTLLIINYDEHGGYYDHVPPPAALAPDLIPPLVQPTQETYEGYQRYGFRVPSVVVSPYAKRNYVSHMVYDHTSILALIERKWNLPALTYRDANANDLTDFLDLDAMAAGVPTFPTLPPLPASGDSTATELCLSSGAGVIPPPGSIIG
jgi:phospholipase C